MKITISVIKADSGSIGGHICPSHSLLQTVLGYIAERGAKLLVDHYVSYTGDDIAIVSTHTHGPNHEEVHKLCWNAFMAGTEVAKNQGLYGAGQDLLKDSFSVNVRGMGRRSPNWSSKNGRTSRLSFSRRIRPTPAPTIFRCTRPLPTR
jgi:fructose 1,6-bisphosphate aldolase/phosphatase